MRSTIFAIFTLEAAHRLENVPESHKCRRMHGHTYEVRVELEGEVNPALGWVIDYAALEKAWIETVHSKLDHRVLNEVLPELEGNTTSEMLADWIRHRIFQRIEPVLGDPHLQVEVWETANCGARAG